MNFRRQFVSGVVFLSTFGLASCASWRERPQENPHPKYYLTLKGHIAKPLRNEVRLRFIQGYAGISEKCSHPILQNLENRQSEYPLKYILYLVKPDVDGNYKLKIPIDKYKPGYCDWQPLTLGITFTEQEYSYFAPTGRTIINYNDNVPHQSGATDKIYNYFCPKNIKISKNDGTNNCSMANDIDEIEAIYIKSNKSYTQTINLDFKADKYAHHK